MTTFEALQAGLDTESYDQLVWAPDARGSGCFVVSGAIAYVALSPRLRPPRPRTRLWWIAAVNLIGCVAFGISAVASYWVPDEGSIVNLAATNLFTALGGLCFLVGSLPLLPKQSGHHVAASSPERRLAS